MNLRGEDKILSRIPGAACFMARRAFDGFNPASHLKRLREEWAENKFPKQNQ